MGEGKLKRANAVADRQCTVTVVVFVVSVGLLTLECDQISNTIGGRELAWFASAAGMVFAALFLATSAFPFKLCKTSLKILFITLVSLASVSFSITGAGFLNRVFADDHSYFESVQKKRVQLRYGRGGRENSRTCFVIFESIGEEDRIVVDRRLAVSLPPDARIRLELKRGALGYAYVVGYTLD